MKVYLDLLKTILEEGYETDDRTGIGTIALPGYHYRVKLEMGDDGFVHNYPLLTTKKVFLRGSFEELKWKIAGNTNIKSLVEKDVHIWTEWPFKKWLESTNQAASFEWFADSERSDYSAAWKEKIKAFEQMIITDEAFAKEWGELGPTYGHHMRNFGEVKANQLGASLYRQIREAGIELQRDDIIVEGIDQLQKVIDAINNNPKDRRIIMSLWNPHDNSKTLLPPCPCFYQFFANQKGILHLNLYQRSCDSFLGVPFNDNQDALLLILLAKVTGRKPGMFNHFFGDVHIYKNHIKQVQLQLTREPRALPSIRVNKDTTNIHDIMWEDIELINYNPYPGIKAPVAV